VLGTAASLSIARSHSRASEHGVVAPAPHPGVAPASRGDSAKAVLLKTAALREEIEARLEDLLPSKDRAPARLNEAVRYSVLSPGKRLRPIITVMVADACGHHCDAALDAGCAIEMVHAASLVVDDLPSMDDAALRRARPTTHKVFGEATGILAAISAMNHGFGIVSELKGVCADNRTRLASLFSKAIGPDGLSGGQEFDVNGAAGASDADIEIVNRRKTGALFSLAAQAGALCGVAGDMSVTDEQLRRLDTFGNHLGLAFQTLDDIIDVKATSAAGTGKDANQDGDKPTLARVQGPDAAQAVVVQHLALALDALEAGIGPSPDMRILADFVFDTALNG